MRFIYSFLLFSCCFLTTDCLMAQGNYQAPGNGNPIIPGYFADPTVKKFGDTYYIYATTDGNGGGLGPSQVWTSKDFVNWTIQDMNWPTTHNYWAPDVAFNNGKYYLYYCQPTVEVYGASSETPVGPWTPLFADGKAVVPNYLVPKVITLDGQTFKDDDGKYYMTWGTWGIYPGFGCGVGLLNPDMRSFSKTAQIPNTLAKDFFEGSFMFKRKGIYYLMYSSGYCENETYRVQYAMSKTGPMEGFTFGKNNPILATSADGTVHGPGHNSVLQIGDDYYIIYHRHNNPHSGGGYNRQVCADKLVFDADGNIEKVIPTHTGVGFLSKNTNPYPNLAYIKKVTASSSYSADYKPEFAVDDNNGTFWKPKDNSDKAAWLQVDLGKLTPVKRVLTQFEYATWYYQYLIEYSADGKQWKIFSDKRNNHWHGSPAVDEGDVKARYIKLTITNTEYPGLYKAVWNLKVFGDGPAPVVPENLHQQIAEKYTQKGLLINLDAADLQTGTAVKEWKNAGALGGKFKTNGKAPVADFIAGKKALVFTGRESLTSSFNVPLSLAGNNSYTVSFWAYAPQLKDENPLLAWSNNNDQLTAATFGYGTNRDFGAAQHSGFADLQYTHSQQLASKWHHVAITFDGTFEKVYVDGALNNQENKMLFVKLANNFVLGSDHEGRSHFSGAIASLQVYDGPLAEPAIKALYTNVKPSRITVYLNAAKLAYGKLKTWPNEGDAGGSLSSNTEPVVQDVAGRISVKFPEKTLLTLSEPLALKSSYSIVASMFDTRAVAGKWHLIIKTYNGTATKEFIDGVPSTKADALTINAAGNGIEGLSGAIAGLSIYRYVLSNDEIKTLNTVWQQNLHLPVDSALAFKQTPKAVTPAMVRMEAADYAKGSNNSLKYNFTRLVNNIPVKQSGWVDEPYYMDYGLAADQQYSYTFKVRDNAGNVTGDSPAINVSTASNQFTVYADDFNGSIWDGFIGKGAKQSAQHIIAKSDTLTLESDNTYWDGSQPYGPFIYKNISGDFVAEVEVSNVSGLAEKKVAGNNDAGLMVRFANNLGDSTHTEQLLQNSVFPAWNVGNMFTNFAYSDRRQTNIQTAWNYNKYLQIQREGNLFYVRTSSDNINWVDLPGSPALRMDLDKKPVQVGLYQCTYGPKGGFASFANFRLIEGK